MWGTLTRELEPFYVASAKIIQGIPVHDLEQIYIQCSAKVAKNADQKFYKIHENQMQVFYTLLTLENQALLSENPDNIYETINTKANVDSQEIRKRSKNILEAMLSVAVTKTEKIKPLSSTL